MAKAQCKEQNYLAFKSGFDAENSQSITRI